MVDKDTFYNIMVILTNSHRILTTQIPYEALTDESYRLLMAQEMSRIGLLIDLYGPPMPESSEPPEHPGLPQRVIDGINRVIG